MCILIGAAAGKTEELIISLRISSNISLIKTKTRDNYKKVDIEYKNTTEKCKYICKIWLLLFFRIFF